VVPSDPSSQTYKRAMYPASLSKPGRLRLRVIASGSRLKRPEIACPLSVPKYTSAGSPPMSVVP
jgi:hypothetical protein